MPPVPGDHRYQTLTRLSQANRTVVFLAMACLVLAGLLLPGAVGAVALLALVAGLAGLLRPTWRHIPPALRAVRVVLLGGLVAAALVKLI